MSRALLVTLVAAVAIGAHLTAVWLLPTPPVTEARPIEDDADRHVYYMRGSWLPRAQVPYLEVHSEYPEIATWYCALPYLFIDAPAHPAAYEQAPPPELFERYANVHSTFMAVGLVLLVFVTARLAQRLGRSPWRGLFLLLPATMFFALSRYDVLPALLISASLLLQLERRHLAAIVVLSLAVLTKWYPILFLPFYLNHARTALGRRILPGLAVSAATAAVVLGTTFVTGGLRKLEIATPAERAAAGSEAALFAKAGAATVLHPYLHQGSRKTNPGGLYLQMQERWFDITPNGSAETWILRALTILQFAVVVFAFVVPMRDGDRLLRWMCLGTALFVLFAKFYSPQWVMWTTALAAPFMRRAALVACAVFLELFVWFHFSIAPGLGLRGTRAPDGTWELSDVWYHLYDVRIAATALFAVLVAWSLRRRPAREPVALPQGA